MQKISILIPTYNEADNVKELTAAITQEMENLTAYSYEIIFIDNDSKDETRDRIRQLCVQNKNIKAIFNAKNFGQNNSPYYGLMQTTGDCAILMCADFQDPVEMIPKLVYEWEQGYHIVSAIKTTSRENKGMRFLRTCYYKLIKKFSQVEQIEHFTGFGLYDREFINLLRELKDPTPSAGYLFRICDFCHQHCHRGSLFPAETDPLGQLPDGDGANIDWHVFSGCSPDVLFRADRGIHS